MPLAWDIGCHYPGCGGGNIVGKKFCPKHVRTPFETKVEVNAYNRAKKEARKELGWLLANVYEILFEDSETAARIKMIRKHWKIK